MQYLICPVMIPSLENSKKNHRAELINAKITRIVEIKTVYRDGQPNNAANDSYALNRLPTIIHHELKDLDIK